jgi:hypothetical protein
MNSLTSNKKLNDQTDKLNSVSVIVEKDLVSLLPCFLNNRLEDFEKLSHFLQIKDFDSIKRIGHDLRGVPGAFGYEFIVDIGRDIESAASLNDAESIGQILKRYQVLIGTHEICIEGDYKTYHIQDFCLSLHN